MVGTDGQWGGLRGDSLLSVTQRNDNTWTGHRWRNRKELKGGAPVGGQSFGVDREGAVTPEKVPWHPLVSAVFPYEGRLRGRGRLGTKSCLLNALGLRGLGD